MSRYRYPATQKLKAVRRVVRDGQSVAKVAREMGVSEGSLFFWVRRYREMNNSSHAVKTAQAGVQLRPTPAMVVDDGNDGSEMSACGSLVAYLRHVTAA